MALIGLARTASARVAPGLAAAVHPRGASLAAVPIPVRVKM